jgi:DNA-binding transcriptional LysR family regulator
MDMRALRSFLILSEELHFGRAATRAGITQPALSHQIARLEADLGVVLFERTSRRVALTDAGTALIVGARRILTDAERARRHCRDAAAGGAGQLALAAIGAALNSVVPALVRALRDEHPGMATQVTQMDTPVALGALRDGVVDVAIVRSAPDAPDVAIRDLIAEPMIAVLPESHPLAGREPLDVARLRDEDFVLWPRSVSESFHDQVIGVCQRAGFSPRVAMEATDIETQLGLVSAGIGVSLQPAGFAALRRVGVRFERLAPPVPKSMLQLAWLRREPSPAARALLELASTVLRRREDWFPVAAGSGGA